jgi:hypothetical protein
MFGASWLSSLSFAPGHGPQQKIDFIVLNSIHPILSSRQLLRSVSLFN